MQSTALYRAHVCGATYLASHWRYVAASAERQACMDCSRASVTINHSHKWFRPFARISCVESSQWCAYRTKVWQHARVSLSCSDHTQVRPASLWYQGKSRICENDILEPRNYVDGLTECLFNSLSLRESNYEAETEPETESNWREWISWLYFKRPESEIDSESDRMRFLENSDELNRTALKIFHSFRALSRERLVLLK